jgi:hypothetical protein
MKSPKIVVTLKKKKNRKAEIELPEILVTFIRPLCKKKWTEAEDEIDFFKIPNWLYQFFELLSFLHRVIKSINFLVWIIIMVIALLTLIFIK